MELLELWEKRRVQFEQCMELQLFNRDCEHANASMTKQEVRRFCTICFVKQYQSYLIVCAYQFRPSGSKYTL